MARGKMAAPNGSRGTGRLEPDRTGHILGLSKSGFHEVAYVEWGPTEADHVVICVHGLTRQGRDFDYLASELRLSGTTGRSVPTWSAEGRADGCGIRPTIPSCNTAPT